MRIHEGVEVPGGGQAVERSFEVFARRERRALLAFAWSLTGSFAVAEEIVREVLTAAWRAWDRLDTYDKPGAWARRSVANLASNRRRSTGREQRALARVASRPDLDPVEMVDIGEAAVDAELWATVRRLPDRQAQVVALHYLEDRSVASIAETLQCAEGTVKAHLYRGRLSLARALGLLTDEDEPAHKDESADEGEQET